MCRFCDRFWEWFRKQSSAWERAHSNEHELWSKESDHNRELITQADAITKTDPAASFRLCLEAAEAGSVWATEIVAWHYRMGNGVSADLNKALEYYYRAICGGSWMATIDYARLLATLGDDDTSEKVLSDGVESGFVPAYFWLAWLRYKRFKTREICKEVRPLLEYAAKMGHPAAKRTLAQWMLLGRFGPSEIFRGVALHLRSGTELLPDVSEEPREATP